MKKFSTATNRQLATATMMLAASLSAANVLAGALPNGIYVERVGGMADFTDGAVPTSTRTTALPVYIDTFNAGGGLSTPVTTLSYTSSSPPANTQILTDIADGTATSGTATPYAVNIMSLSPNGRYLTIGGYTDTAGNTITSSGGNKSIGSLDLQTGDSSSQIFYANSTVPRGLVTQDLTNYYTLNSGTGLQLVTPGANKNAAAARVAINSAASRTIAIYGNQLFLSSTATLTNGSSKGLAIVGTGLPTASATANYFITTAGGNPEEFVLLNQTSENYASTGLDTAYIATDSGVEKWTYTAAGGWTSSYVLGSGGGMVGVAYGGKDSSGNPILFGVTQGNVASVTSGFSNSLMRLVDTGSSSAWTNIANSPANSLFRGVQFGAPAAVGDINGDGTINSDDYSLIDRGFNKYQDGQIATNAAGWRDGDLNYDGIVNSSDYLAMDTAYAIAHPSEPLDAIIAEREGQFGDAYVAALEAAVPEPTSLSLLGVGAISILRRRRSR